MSDSLANSRQAGASEIAKFIRWCVGAYMDAPIGDPVLDPMSLEELAAWMADRIVRRDLSPPQSL